MASDSSNSTLLSLPFDITKLSCFVNSEVVPEFQSNVNVFFVIMCVGDTLYYVHNDSVNEALTWTKIHLNEDETATVELPRGKRVAAAELHVGFTRPAFTVGKWRSVFTKTRAEIYPESTTHTNAVSVTFPLLGPGSMLAVPLALWWTPLIVQPLSGTLMRVPCSLESGRCYLLSVEQYVNMRAWMGEKGATTQDVYNLYPDDNNYQPTARRDFLWYLPQPCTIVRYWPYSSVDVQATYCATIKHLYLSPNRSTSSILVSTDVFGQHTHRLVQGVDGGVLTQDRQLLIPNIRGICDTWMLDGYCRNEHLEWDMARMGMLPLHPCEGLEEALLYIYNSTHETWSQCISRLQSLYCPFFKHAAQPLLEFLGAPELKKPCPNAYPLVCLWEAQNRTRSFPAEFCGFPSLLLGDLGRVVYRSLDRDSLPPLSLFPSR
ncbi:ORF92 [Ranid herpesvirus 2]|uniref:ORF92 n=1 Tax=Ranid herpesvirus 2 TaxID=389214 RepID=Q14W14_9VIRU|nr:ORF92 [Ranid herpesvirus 2]ABG25610.1 ORF92 [Ranid herpesvirus 2]